MRTAAGGASPARGPVQRLLVAIFVLAAGCSHFLAGESEARKAAAAALSLADPQVETTIAFGPECDAKTRRLFEGLRPAATLTGTDSLRFLPENVIRIDQFVVTPDTATFTAIRGPVLRHEQHSLSCGTALTVTLRRDEHGWIVGPLTVRTC